MLGRPQVSSEPKVIKARHGGKCRGCRILYRPGENVVVRGKGNGAYHLRCWEVRVAKLDFVKNGLRNAQQRRRPDMAPRTDRGT
jgi:hypothetical protein